MSRGTQATIDLSALKHNLTRIRQIAPNCKILAMVKANGYGHGLLRVVNGLIDADGFGVAALEEALILRQEGWQKPILVMSGFQNDDELKLMLNNNISSVIHQNYQLEILEKNFFNKNFTIWLKIDTGMHRLGFMVNEFLQAYQRLAALSYINKPFTIMTHLADADNVNNTFTLKQMSLFDALTDSFINEKSIANSAAILAYPNSHRDWVRPGILLYGVSPFPGETGEKEGFQPVMTLTSKLIAIKNLQKNDFIGYGCDWQCDEDMPIGIVAIGYGDGYPRHAKNGTPVMINGEICPLVGRVSMDMITIDLRHAKNAKIGDIVLLWGKDLPVEKIADCAGTIPYELLCDVTRRVKFIEK